MMGRGYGLPELQGYLLAERLIINLYLLCRIRQSRNKVDLPVIGSIREP